MFTGQHAVVGQRSDEVQQQFDVDVGALRCDVLATSPYKWYGPHAGVLAIERDEVDLAALQSEAEASASEVAAEPGVLTPDDPEAAPGEPVDSGEEPAVIEYLNDPPSRETLKELIDAMGITPRQLLREKGTPYGDLGLDNPTLSDDALLDAMMAHPILINRPIVVTDKGAALCRPSEKVLGLLANPMSSYVKEDGEVVTLRNVTS